MERVDLPGGWYFEKQAKDSYCIFSRDGRTGFGHVSYFGLKIIQEACKDALAEGIGREWLDMSSAPTTGDTVILLLDDNSVSPGWYDDCLSDDGEFVRGEEPGWWWFGKGETGPAVPIAWQPLPKPRPSAQSLPRGGR